MLIFAIGISACLGARIVHQDDSHVAAPTDTGITCYVFDCAAELGPSTCSDGKCTCQNGFEATKGYCVTPGLYGNLTANTVMGLTTVTKSTVVSPRPGVNLQVNITVPPGCLGDGRKMGYMLVATPYGARIGDNVYVPLQHLNFGWLGYGNKPVCAAMVLYTSQGSWASTGEFNLWATSKENNLAVVKYANSASWSSGAVLPFGISAMGIRVFLVGNLDAADANIRAQFILWASPSMRYAGFEQGVMRTGVIDMIGPMFDLPSEEVYSLASKHEDPGAFWEKSSFSNWSRVSWPAYMGAAWFDIFQEDQLEAWKKYRTQSADNVKHLHRLSIGPGGHCHPFDSWPKTTNTSAGTYMFPVLPFVKMRSALAETFASASTQEEFEAALQQYEEVVKPYPRVIAYIFSGAGDYLTALDDLPSFDPDLYYFSSSSSSNLSRSIPPVGSLSYIYDPAKPVPTVGGRFFAGVNGTPCGPLDQKATRLSNSDKLLYFLGAPLSEPYAIFGPITASLVVGSNATDTDFEVKLVDIRTSGAEVLVASGIARMAYRGGDTRESMAPGKNYINISLSYAGWVFDKGSQIGVWITSSDAPGYRPNPNTGARIGNISLQHNVTAKNTLYIGESKLILPRVDVSQLPRVPGSSLPGYTATTDFTWIAGLLHSLFR